MHAKRPGPEGQNSAVRGGCAAGGKRQVAVRYPGDGVVVLLDAVVRFLQARRLKRRLAHQQRVPESEGKKKKVVLEST